MNRKQRIKKFIIKSIKRFLYRNIDNSYLHSGHFSFDGKGETHIKIILIRKLIKKNQ